jgi:hypothetical protein
MVSSYFQSTWAGVDSILKFLEADRFPEVPVCRFSNENFSQIMAEYVLGQVNNLFTGDIKIIYFLTFLFSVDF